MTGKEGGKIGQNESIELQKNPMFLKDHAVARSLIGNQELYDQQIAIKQQKDQPTQQQDQDTHRNTPDKKLKKQKTMTLKERRGIKDSVQVTLKNTNENAFSLRNKLA